MWLLKILKLSFFQAKVCGLNNWSLCPMGLWKAWYIDFKIEEGYIFKVKYSNFFIQYSLRYKHKFVVNVVQVRICKWLISKKNRKHRKRRSPNSLYGKDKLGSLILFLYLKRFSHIRTSLKHTVNYIDTNT